MNTVTSLVAAVLNSMWQAAIVAAAVWLALRTARRINAATRFAIWWAALAVVLVLPAAPWAVSSAREWLRPATIASARPRYAPPPGPVSAIELAPLLSVPETSARYWPAGVAALWALFLLRRSAGLLRSYLQVRRLKRNSSPSMELLPHSRRSSRVLLSSMVASPIAVGFAPPAVILPETLGDRLSRQEMDHVLLHESAHLARWDDWTTLFARVLGAAFAWHPVVWFVLRRIEVERELACDEWVVARTQSAKGYARSLARLYELRFGGQHILQDGALVSGMFSNRGGLCERVEWLLKGAREVTARVSPARVGAACLVLLALATAASVMPRWIVFAQTPRPAFDVAAIKRNLAETNGHSMTFAARPGGRLQVVNNATSNLIYNAYGIAPYQLIGAPDWVASERYDIDARGAATATQKEIMLMLQTLLADRFAMKARFETRQMSAYILTVAKAGPKLTFSSPENCVPRDSSKPNPDATNLCGNNLLSREAGWKATRISMQGVVGALSMALRHPVIDQTGIKGTFDVSMKWTDDPAQADTPDAPPPLPTALREALGLDVKMGRGAVDVLVIDHIERPTVN